MSKEFTTDEVAQVGLHVLGSSSRILIPPPNQHHKAGDLWVIIDSKVFDLSKFASLHPGGLSVLLDSEVAGKDATSAFFSLHRHEVLLTPRYARLQIGRISGAKELVPAPAKGALSEMPYGEPSWLAKGYHSPYFTEGHRKFQQWMRKFVDEHLYAEAQAREEDGKFPDRAGVELQGCVRLLRLEAATNSDLLPLIV